MKVLLNQKYFESKYSSQQYMKKNETQGLNMTLWYSYTSWKICIEDIPGICIENQKISKIASLASQVFFVNPLYKGYQASGIENPRQVELFNESLDTRQKTCVYQQLVSLLVIDRSMYQLVQPQGSFDLGDIVNNENLVK